MRKKIVGLLYIVPFMREYTIQYVFDFNNYITENKLFIEIKVVIIMLIIKLFLTNRMNIIRPFSIIVSVERSVPLINLIATDNMMLFW
jgi:hypothetical protein